MTKRTFDDFDRHAKNYRDTHSDNVRLSGADSFYFAEHKVKLLAQFESDNKYRLLDLGCGDGTTEKYIHQYFPSIQCDGIDVSEASLAEAARKNIHAASFTLYDGEVIPFEDNFFDIVFVAAVFHHIDFSLHDALIQEIYRVLKPGGRVYFFEHNPLNPVTRYFVSTCVFDKDAKLLGHGYSKKLLKAHTFRNVLVKFILFFPRKKIFSGLLKHEDKLGWFPLGGQYLLRAIK
jgi:ubiquinone/menaquinone biosynthesis C-methylase UbiE